MKDGLSLADRMLYDRDGAAEQLSTSPRRIDELRRAGILLAVKDGREWKYTAQDLQRYVDSLKTSAEF
ncbi:helix-turn-helix domain-containing protein [Mycolicibacterium goodii]|uniref:helix-turn-helix domain-containing protein n=1 Tax=Mycolicibacterium goodii TaxID=134601 RepID=UPI00257CB1D2|nr:helix-turn-helix domain-containing protein [Mycolicibacterium goodii]